MITVHRLDHFDIYTHTDTIDESAPIFGSISLISPPIITDGKFAQYQPHLQSWIILDEYPVIAATGPTLASEPDVLPDPTIVASIETQQP